MKHIFYLFMLISIITISCSQNSPLIEDFATYSKDHADWQTKRIERLKAENGWLNLAGLFWLEEGENTFGSDESNNIIFPESFPDFGGKIILEDSTVSIKVSKGIEITVDGKTIEDLELRHDQQKNTSLMEFENFRWFIIKRGEKYAIRLRDLQHPRIEELDHIPSYPLSEDWVIEAELVPFDSAITVEVPTVIPGFSEFYKVPGELRFRKNKKTYSLLPFASGKGYFLIVGDATNGIDTYGAGRFMYSDQVEGNKVILDFNRAYNPPCAFSPYATCPLPPLENILDLEITAGEKGVHLE